MLTDDQFEALRLKLEQTFHETVSRRRIQAIHTNSAYRWQPPLHIEIDRSCAGLTKEGPPELVVAIYESHSFLVCTPDHGFERGSPHIFTRADVRQVVDMDMLLRMPDAASDKSTHEPE